MKKKFLSIGLLFLMASGMVGCSEDEDGVLPEQNVSSEVKDFFNESLRLTDPDRAPDGFFEEIYWGDHPWVYHVINSAEELASIYTGTKGIPSIDFDKYTLVIGQTSLMDGSCRIYKYSLDFNSYPIVVNLYVKHSPNALQSSIAGRFWGLFPKFKADELKLNKMYYEEK